MAVRIRSAKPARAGLEFVALAAALAGCSDPAAPPRASQLSFAVQPTNIVAGSAVAPAVQVAVLDAEGNVVTAPAPGVTISLAANSPGGTLLGITTVVPVSGVATFTDLTITKAGSGYALQASLSGLPNATSGAFAVAPGAMDSLVISSGNGQSATIGRVLAGPLVVRATDEYGNPLQGVAIEWAISSGLGVFRTFEALTDATGISSAYWQLGRTSGDPQAASASNGSFVASFSATATALRVIGLRNVRAGVFELVHLNAEDGAVVLASARPEITSTMQGQMAVDATGGRYFILNGTLFTIAMTTGAIVSSHDLSAQGISEIQYDSTTQSILGITTRTGVHELVRVNPQSGGVTSVGFVAEMFATNQGSASLDAYGGRFFVVAVDTSGVERLYSLSTTTAEVQASPSVGTLSLSGTRYDPGRGTLYAVGFPLGDALLMRVNPVSGEGNSQGMLVGVQGVAQGEAALDLPSDRYVFLGSDGAIDRLYSVDLETGAILSSPAVAAIANPQVVP